MKTKQTANNQQPTTNKHMQQIKKDFVYMLHRIAEQEGSLGTEKWEEHIRDGIHEHHGNFLIEPVFESHRIRRKGQNICGSTSWRTCFHKWRRTRKPPPRQGQRGRPLWTP